MSRARPWMRAAGFGEVAAPTVAVDPQRTALIAGDVTFSYRRLDERARHVAGVLAEREIGRGDVVALATGNDWRFVEALLGILRRGAVALLVNIKLGSEALAYVLDHSEAKLVIVAPHVLDRIGGRPTLEIGAEYEHALAKGMPADAVTVEPDDLAILMYTSGSTGRPKGVMLSHSNTWWQARSDARTMLLDAHDRGLVMGPLYHANALWAVLLPMLHAGGSVVVLPDFDAAAVLEAIDRHAITFTSGTPSMYSLLLAQPDLSRYDLSSVELLQCGSAPVSEELLTRIVGRFGGELVETYGLTEGGANVLTPRWGVKKLGSTGLPVPDVELRVVDPADAALDCGPDEVGELWTRSPANALGYLHAPDATAERFTHDGWLKTGDLFRRDEQGYCYFCGRTDDMISVGGENVYPKEVEAILLRHPAVDDVGVVPVAHAVKGQAPVAFVVLKAGVHVTEEQLREHALVHGPAFAHPRRVFIVDALPIGGTNKLDRTALEQRAAELLPTGLVGGRQPSAR